MKKHFWISLMLISFSISLISLNCNKKITLTGPAENTGEAKSLAKVTAASIDYNKDTVITLPKSGKEIIISKEIPIDKVNVLDNYLSTHTMSTKTQNNISPNLPDCTRYYQYIWYLTDQFKSVPGKFLGIWCNYLSAYTLYHTYGFNMLFVTNNSDIDTARNGGFQYDSLMLGLSSFSTAEATINAANTGGRYVGYYHIDEPIETGAWDPYTIDVVASDVYPKSVFLSSYKWPIVTTMWGQIYGLIINSLSNIYIICDQYHGDCYGSAADYWGRFHSYYGAAKTPANWLHVSINNGTGGGHVACPWINDNSTSWYDLLQLANSGLGINKVWLYALDTGNEAAVASFCETAAYWGWLLRFARQFVIVWKCNSPSPCTNCNFQQKRGSWYVEDSYYTGITEWIND